MLLPVGRVNVCVLDGVSGTDHHAIAQIDPGMAHAGGVVGAFEKDQITGLFQEGEMRKRIQFMYGGELQTIKFEYTGPSLESVLDRLPTAKVLQVTEKGWIVEAEVFGTGIDMWVRSQGDSIKDYKTIRSDRI